MSTIKEYSRRIINSIHKFAKDDFDENTIALDEKMYPFLEITRSLIHLYPLLINKEIIDEVSTNEEYDTVLMSLRRQHGEFLLTLYENGEHLLETSSAETFQDDLDKVIEELKEKNQEVFTSIDKMKKTFKEYDNQRMELLEKEELEKENKKELLSKKEELDQVQDTVSNLKKEIAALEEETRDLEEHKKIERDLDTQKSLLIQKKKEFQRLNRNIESIKQENGEIEKSIADMNDLKTEYDRLQTKLDENKKKQRDWAKEVMRG